MTSVRGAKKALYLVVVAFTVAAVYDQVRRPRGERNWHGSLLGVPYDFRAPGFRAGDLIWHRDDPRLITPRPFGVGWDMNLYGLLRLVRRQVNNTSDGPRQALVQGEPFGEGAGSN